MTQAQLCRALEHAIKDETKAPFEYENILSLLPIEHEKITKIIQEEKEHKKIVQALKEKYCRGKL